MKKILFAASLMFGLQAMAQDLPMPSPSASVEQRIGLTDVSVDYSRPSMKGREIFGGLVPYQKMWRTGANGNTTLTFSTPVNVGGTMVEPGTYALLTIPGEDSWEMILNTKTDMWGTNGYTEANDVARIKVKPMSGAETETFTIGFANLKPNAADLQLSWADVVVSVPLEVNVKDQALANIEEALAKEDDEKRWMVLRNAAGYHLNNEGDLDQALNYMQESIEMMGDSWYSHYLHAQILAAKGMHKQAIEAGERSIEVGHEQAEAKGDDFGYEEMIEETMEDWKEAKKKA